MSARNPMESSNQFGFVRPARWVLGAATLACAFGSHAATTPRPPVAEVAGDPGAPAGARDPGQGARVTFSVGARTINASKASSVLEDPFNGSSDPKAIPGATILYCIAIENAGPVDAADVSLAEEVPSHASYLPGSIRVVDGAVACDDAAHAAATVAITDNADDDPAERAANAGISGNSRGPGDTVPTVRTLVASLGASRTTTTLFKVTID